MLTFSKGCSIILFGQRKRHLRKCRNWQTSKTKDLVIIAIVWVQVPSSAFNMKDSGTMPESFLVKAERSLPPESRSPLRSGRRKTEVPRTSCAIFRINSKG